ncbi:prephenate dehydrogenase [Virgibacillus doumboii]|uniref:prephenate dehydrogenase n=1 Tax=Virgibacillus doumboii TaxID=2697503 RepID=UPI0019681F13|nr:prephenate dehydrogenase [Virgibacillus doumboii]
MKRTIFIIGLGLIGGSLARSIAKSNEKHIIGYDVDQHTLDFAHMNEIIDESSTDFTESAQQADIIILATPITETLFFIKKLNQIPFDHEVIVTDVSSVKKPIIDAANEISNEHITFIGGHPMAGSHKKGIQASKAHLFENAIYVLTPSETCSDTSISAIKEVLKATKSNFITLQASEHDEMTGVISHFPHLIASSLVHQAIKWGDTHTYIPKLAAGGFRDVTRIASSNPELWQDIFFHNRGKMSQLLQDWINEMTDIKQLIEQNSKSEIIKYLKQAKDYRDGLGTAKKGAIPSFFDLYVDIRDQTGAIASVANVLAEEDISITNIEILEIRQGITGVLRLTVSTKEAQQKSYQILHKVGYEVMLEK